ncbi:hypothetical protein LCGC14_0143030 [marine sediment metagenome]|uniref:Uncharacterized protein n=1 Tax=marine sediment metagenome TaxID=412755 RepID=A0A0F9VGU0_9ZZZZ
MRPELYRKLNSWVNKFGGDRAFANRINEVPKTIRELVYGDAELMKRFGFDSVKPLNMDVCPNCKQKTLEVHSNAPEGSECFCHECDWPYN